MDSSKIKIVPTEILEIKDSDLNTITSTSKEEGVVSKSLYKGDIQKQNEDITFCNNDRPDFFYFSENNNGKSEPSKVSSIDLIAIPCFYDEMLKTQGNGKGGTIIPDNYKTASDTYKSSGHAEDVLRSYTQEDMYRPGYTQSLEYDLLDMAKKYSPLKGVGSAFKKSPSSAAFTGAATLGTLGAVIGYLLGNSRGYGSGELALKAGLLGAVGGGLGVWYANSKYNAGEAMRRENQAIINSPDE